MEAFHRMIVRVCVVPNTDINCFHNANSPLSVVINDGAPNHEIQPEMSALATEVAQISGMGIASGHLVNLSMHVSR